MTYRNRFFDPKGHLTPSALAAIKADSLPEDELILVTTHIADCLSCASAFADSFTDCELKEVPSGFVKEIESRLPSSRVRDNKNLLFYSLRVGLAVCASIVMVFSSSLSFYANADTYTEIIRPPELRFMQSINTGLKDFSQKLLDMEVFPNETEKR